MNTFKNIRKVAFTAGLVGFLSLGTGCSTEKETPYIPSGCDYAIEIEEEGKKTLVQITKRNMLWMPNAVSHWYPCRLYKSYEEARLRSDCLRYAVFHNGDFHPITKENLLVAPDGLGYANKDGE